MGKRSKIRIKVAQTSFNTFKKLYYSERLNVKRCIAKMRETIPEITYLTFIQF